MTPEVGIGGHAELEVLIDVKVDVVVALNWQSIQLLPWGVRFLCCLLSRCLGRWLFGVSLSCEVVLSDRLFGSVLAEEGRAEVVGVGVVVLISRPGLFLPFARVLALNRLETVPSVATTAAGDRCVEAWRHTVLIGADLSLALHTLLIFLPLFATAVLLPFLALNLPFFAALLPILVAVLLLKHGLVRLILSLGFFLSLPLGELPLGAFFFSLRPLELLVVLVLVLVEAGCQALRLSSAPRVRAQRWVFVSLLLLDDGLSLLQGLFLALPQVVFLLALLVLLPPAGLPLLVTLFSNRFLLGFFFASLLLQKLALLFLLGLAGFVGLATLEILLIAAQVIGLLHEFLTLGQGLLLLLELAPPLLLLSPLEALLGSQMGERLL